MSSSQQADPAARTARPKSLRAKLLGQLLALLAVICVIFGVVTELALYGVLLHQRDEQLTATVQRGQQFAGDSAPQRPMPPPPPGAPRDPLRAPGQAVGTLTAVVAGDSVLGAGRLDGGGQVQPVPAGLGKSLVDLPADDAPRTVHLGPLGSYRVIATDAPNGAVAITGLPLTDVHDTLVTAGFILGGVALGGLVITGALGMVTVRRTLRPLDAVAATARRVSEQRLDRGEVALLERVAPQYTDARTEVGQVGAALNRMLGHVGDALSARQASETRVRQFVADASHELRTPLAAIRGYAELTRRGNEEVPEQVRYAMGRVESESSRMTALVEDLLLLARLDAGRPLGSETVDLSRVVADAVSDATVTGPRHRWRLDLPAEPVLLTGDEARLRQVLVNLLANARLHTPAGSTVDIGLSTADGTVLLSVADDGPGIPAEQQPEVFERFARGDSSRSRAAGGTGLGLAIVAAVVAAHRGSVMLHSLPGRTEFTVRLPAHS